MNECRKMFDKMQYPFFIKTLNKVGIQETCINIIRAVYDKPVAQKILKQWKAKCFSFKIRNKEKCLLDILFKIVSGVLVTAVTQEREIKGIHIVNEAVKLSLFADDMK